MGEVILKNIDLLGGAKYKLSTITPRTETIKEALDNGKTRKKTLVKIYRYLITFFSVGSLEKTLVELTGLLYENAVLNSRRMDVLKMDLSDLAACLLTIER